MQSNDPTLHLLPSRESRGNAHRLAEYRRGTRHRLELVDIFSEIRGELGYMFRGETYYGEPEGYRGKHQADS